MFERAVLWKFGKRTKYTQFLEPHDLKVVLQRVQLIQHMLLVPGFIAPSREGMELISVSDVKAGIVFLVQPLLTCI